MKIYNTAYEDDNVTHAIRLRWGLLWESANKYEYVTLLYGFGKLAIVAGKAWQKLLHV